MVLSRVTRLLNPINLHNISLGNTHFLILTLFIQKDPNSLINLIIKESFACGSPPVFQPLRVYIKIVQSS